MSLGIRQIPARRSWNFGLELSHFVLLFDVVCRSVLIERFHSLKLVQVNVNSIAEMTIKVMADDAIGMSQTIWMLGRAGVE